MAFNKEQAERNLENTLERVREVSLNLQRNIIDYRRADELVDEDDEVRTFRDMRVYALSAYRELDSILTFLDRYK